MLAPDVELSKGILGRARRAEDDLIEGGVVALSHIDNGQGAEGVGAGAEIGDNLDAGLIETAHDRHRIEGRHVGGGGGGVRLAQERS